MTLTDRAELTILRLSLRRLTAEDWKYLYDQEIADLEARCDRVAAGWS